MTLQPRSHPNSHLERRLMSQALAALYVAGGLLTILSLVLPHPETVNEVGALTASALAIAAGVSVLIAGARLPLWSFEALVASGSILISIGIHFGGYASGTPSYAFFYLWIGVYSFNFFRFPRALAQMLLSATCHLLVLLIDGRSAFLVTGWMVTWGVLFVTGIIVGWLSGQVRTLADTDGLTGLRNRRAWDTELAREVAHAARSKEPLSVILIDIDGLKAVNDREGHQGGDRLLKEAAAAFSNAVRSGDLIARLGGDEFGILLRACPLEGAEASLVRLQASSDFDFCGGCAQWDGEESVDRFLHRADSALYEKKSTRTSGRAPDTVAGIG